MPFQSEKQREWMWIHKPGLAKKWSHTYGTKPVKKAKKPNPYKYKLDRRMKFYGETDLDKKVIRMNPRKGDMINTIIHEEMHRKHPQMTEKMVRKKTKEIEGKMSLKQMINLLKSTHKKTSSRN